MSNHRCTASILHELMRDADKEFTKINYVPLATFKYALMEFFIVQ